MDIINLAGILNSENAVINTGTGDDRILARASGRGPRAIRNQGTILMGGGDDLISNRNDLISNIDDNDTPSLGVTNEQTGIINTGSGNDEILLDSGIWHAGTALRNYGVIDTGRGDDKIDATEYGRGFNDPGFPISPNIVNTGTIDMGRDNDTLTGAVIKNSGTIDMGRGDDFLGARIQGGGNIDMGRGDDLVSIKVWPIQDNSHIIDGGWGYDQVEFSFDDLVDFPYPSDSYEFSFEDDIRLDIIGNTVQVDLLPYFATWTLSGFELFTFDGESYTFEELSDL